MQRRAGCDKKRAEAGEVQPIVRVTPISRTPPCGHEPRGPELTEVVRDEVLGFPYQLSELAHTPIAPRQVTEKLPAEWVADQLEKLEGTFVGSCGDHTRQDRSN
jgi:hypothetical protein